MHIVKVVSVISLMIYYTANPILAQGKEKLSWLSLQEAEAAYKKEKRPVLIDLYTDWCGWCKVMDKKTYSNKNVISYLNEKFYVVKLNAETKEPTSWNGKSFEFNSSNQTNNIALYLTQGRLAYPTTVLVALDGSEPQAIPGYLTPKDIEVLLKYFGEDKFGKINFDDFHKAFKSSWK